MIVVISKNSSFIEHVSKLKIKIEVFSELKEPQKYTMAIV